VQFRAPAELEREIGEDVAGDRLRNRRHSLEQPRGEACLAPAGEILELGIAGRSHVPRKLEDYRPTSRPAVTHELASISPASTVSTSSADNRGRAATTRQR
jgi:hypothetical protein